MVISNDNEEEAKGRVKGIEETVPWGRGTPGPEQRTSGELYT